MKAKSNINALSAPLPRDAAKVAGLSDEESREAYSRLLPVFDSVGVVSASVDFVAAYCQAFALARSAYHDYRRDGAVLVSAKTGGQYLNPSVTCWKMALDQLERSAKFLSMSPDLIHSSVEAIKAEEKEKADRSAEEKSLIAFTRTG